MSQAYTPGLQVKSRTKYRVQRTLPVPGQVLVRVGDRVEATQNMARAEQPGNIFPLNVANLLSISPGDVPGAMLVPAATAVTPGQKIAMSKGLFGYFRQACESPAAGSIESVSEVTGQVIIRGTPQPVVVNAFVAGTVTEILPDVGVWIETDAAFIQGIFGIGGEQQGTVRVATGPDEDLSPAHLKAEHKDSIVIAGRKITGPAFARARELGVRGLIAGGLDDHDLRQMLGYDLGVAITGSEQIGLTIIITEGFGEIAMAQRTFHLLKTLEGQLASINGATQIRAGVLRPEIVIPLSERTETRDTAARVGGGVLQLGSHVRLIRDPYFGELGTVTGLPHEPQLLASGSKARVLEVRCQTGRDVIVPRANVEIVGGEG